MISSPNYPEFYPSNEDCNMTIVTEESPIKLNFEAFDVGSAEYVLNTYLLLVGWLIDQLLDCLIDSLIHLFIHWFIDSSIDWSVDWFHFDSSHFIVYFHLFIFVDSFPLFYSCSNDYVVIRGGDESKKYCGKKTLAPYISKSNKLFIRFYSTSHPGPTKSGFVATYTSGSGQGKYDVRSICSFLMLWFVRMIE